MSRPSIPKLSLAFKKPLAEEERQHQHQDGGGGGGGDGHPKRSVSLPKLVLPSSYNNRRRHHHHHQESSSPPPNGDAKPQPPQDHPVFLLLPGLAFPAGDSGTPMTVGDLKVLCRDIFSPPSSSSSSSTTTASAPAPQLEFFRLSALVRLTDDSLPAPPGLVVAGAQLHNQELTLGLVDEVVSENRSLRERMALAGEALIALEERSERDAQLIRSLRESLDTLTAQHRTLQEKYAAAAAAAAVQVPPVSPASTSPRHAPHPHTLSHTPRIFHNSFNSLTSPHSRSLNPASSSSHPVNSAAGDGGLFQPQHPLISPTTSPRRRLGCRTGSCTCSAFTPQPSASWICVCGHMSLKHAGGPP